jgi:hypothetical protein
MSLGQPSPPSPDASIASATTAAKSQVPFNAAAQGSSMINQSGPTGSLNYSVTGYTPQGTPIYTANTSLTPAQQNLLEQMQGTQKTAGGQAGSLLSGANYGSESPSQAIGDMTHGLVGQMMGQETSFLQPFFDTQTSQLDAQLKNQGLQPGNPAYDNAMRQNQTNQGLQVNQFLASAMPAEQQIAATQYQMPMTMAESLASFGAPSSPTTGFTSSLPGMSAPNTSADLTSMVTAQQNQYQAQQAQYDAMIKALGGIAGAGTQALMFA